MATLNERIRFTAPKTAKDDWKRQAAARGMSPSGFLREAIDEAMAIEELAKAWRAVQGEKRVDAP